MQCSRWDGCTGGASICGLLNVTELHSKHIAESPPPKCLQSALHFNQNNNDHQPRRCGITVSFISDGGGGPQCFLSLSIQVMFLQHSHRYRRCRPATKYTPPPIAAVFDQQPPLTYRYVPSEHGKDRPIGALYWLVSYVRILTAAHLWTSHRPQWVRSVSKYLVCFDINKLAAVKTIFSNIYLRPSDCCKYV